MPGVIQSPVLVGRDEFVALAGRRLAEVADGAGQLLLVAGEAGIGKTRLLGAIERRARAKGFMVVRAAAFPGDMQSFAGLLLDLAGDLAAAPEPELSDLGHAIASRVRAISTAEGDAHHRRRLLVRDLVDLLITAEPGRPLLMILEDLHWADQLSLDVVGHLPPRLGTRPMLVACAYRSDELYPKLPMRDLRARLLTQRLAEEIRLPRLRPEQIATMAGTVLGRPAPAQVVAAIHSRSDGIPLHVEELLAAVDQDLLTPQSGAAVLAAAVPDTLAEAVLSRAHGLAARTRQVASAAAVIGRSFDFDLLCTVTEADPSDVATALRELRDALLVLPGTDAATFDFRHALIRDTLYADTDLPVRRRLHESVARTAAERGYRDEFVSAHFEHAQRTEDAHRHALAAAREAASISAHRESLDLYRRAVRNLPAGLPVMDRVRLFAALGDEAAATDDNEAAAAAYRTAHELAVGVGEVRAAADLAPRMVAVAHLLGADLDTRVRTLRTALDSLEGVAGADRERTRLWSAMAAAYMLDRRLDEAIEQGERARAESLRIDDEEAALNAEATLGSVLVFAGRMQPGWPYLEEAVRRACRADREAEVARGYRMVGTSASVLVEYDRAQAWLEEGVQYAEQVELWNHRHYMAAHLAHVHWAVGDWDTATRTAEHALADGRGGITTRITAQYVLGYLAMGRGDWTAAAGLLGEASAQGEAMAELQRLSPPLWGLAEAARCQGDHATAVTLCERGHQASANVTDAAYLFPYLLTGVRAHLALGDTDAAEAWAEKVSAVLTARAIPGTLPAVEHARGLLLFARGDLPAAQLALQSAQLSWQTRRRFWEGAWCLLDLAAVAVKSRQHAEAARLLTRLRADATKAGAIPVLTAADALPLTSPRATVPWHPLTAREFEVSQFVAAGLTNRQIAERLVLSPKTISAHVEHILTKLGASRRTEIAAWYATVQRDLTPK
ncbi:LuxR family transcriptional regulator [Acrocarpospora phusangensis]|uniref:LuxR family transcriptional regulator n=2 Tax=Acrocarpospora phusangensis TaxID=1070424 RepID=A0A919Q4L7_9ACTN|nr:LuxR family transcriptional regulator [Acrocarpospora phusangensis]